MENLKHLRALQAFDETATHSNLSQAASVLNVTHGAVSRQIKQLELYLGTTLFHRRPTGMELTKSGERLHQSTQQAFSALQLGVRDVKRLHHRQSITVSLSTSLALKWLVPRLPAFREKHPGIALLLDTNDRLVDFETSEVDVALRFGKPRWEGLFHEQIAQEELVVVASPSLIGNAKVPMQADAISKLPLLYDAFNVAWGDWAELVNLDESKVASDNIKYADSAVLLEAAIDGQGVALARHLLATSDLKSGRLVRLDNSRVPMDRGLFFVTRHGDQDRITVRLFKKWLLSL